MLTLDRTELAAGDFRLAADLEVAPGLTAVIGPSGAGKSTLLAAIAGFVMPETGRLLWNGTDITQHPPGDRPVSIVFQDHNLFPHLDVGANVGLGIRPGRRLSEAEQDRIRATLSEVGLDGFAARRPAQLSGGQQSRAALARALVSDRPVVLLDEPFSALGPGLKREMLDLTAEIFGTTGRTVLIVTHDPGDAARVAPQTILVADGRAHAPTPTDALLADPPESLRGYL